MSSNQGKVPYRQIRAVYDKETITVYQAYPEEIAGPAVVDQKLSASPAFKPTRFTLIKPSWCWMMYRSGYGTKDKGQERILAISMKHEYLQRLLQEAIVTGHSVPLSAEESQSPVRVQWDPERNHKLDVLPYRSIQIGIGGSTSKAWADTMIESIEDVTANAHALKRILEESPKLTEEELLTMGLIPEERPYEVSVALREVLKMGVASGENCSIERP